MEQTSCHTTGTLYPSYLGSLFYIRKQVRGMNELANLLYIYVLQGLQHRFIYFMLMNST